MVYRAPLAITDVVLLGLRASIGAANQASTLFLGQTVRYKVLSHIQELLRIEISCSIHTLDTAASCSLREWICNV
jgi:hypothetical protein